MGTPPAGYCKKRDEFCDLGEMSRDSKSRALMPRNGEITKKTGLSKLISQVNSSRIYLQPPLLGGQRTEGRNNLGRAEWLKTLIRGFRLIVAQARTREVVIRKILECKEKEVVKGGLVK